MSINDRWRDKQLGNTNILYQELVCLEFLKKHRNLIWQWYGVKSNFKFYCEREGITFENNGTGLLLINWPFSCTPGNFVQKVNELITEKIDAVYLAINRYEFIPINDLGIVYKDNMEDSIQQIVDFIHVPLVPLGFAKSEIDGNHFVGSHGLDIFVYERSK